MGTRVFVGGLTYRVRERDLERFFRKYGRVKDISMKNGYAFVEFDDHRDADDAVYELNGKELLGERVIVEHARGTDRSRRSRDRYGGGGFGRRRWDREDRGRGSDRYGPPTRTEYRLIVENLSSRVSWQDLKDYMRQAGEVTYADAHKNRRNEGIVEFISSSDMKAAIDKLDGTELNGRKIRLIEDKSRRRRSRSSSGSRSRTRSRSRSSRSRRSRSSRRSSRSKSKSRGRSKSASRSKSRDRSRSKSKNNRSKSRTRSRSKSPMKNNRSKSRSESKPKNGSVSKDRSRSRSASKGKSKSRSRSPIKKEENEKQD
ncbi:UNVERIFIED_CONTAM: hypothetical protein PYX00_003813 [Menopon gallinae]|uniref:RRM domain-containing protein n=1 Tax=Menopon gallinae TaxID=328185 RepID=A0AAW2I2F2_9NEOP